MVRRPRPSESEIRRAERGARKGKENWLLIKRTDSGVRGAASRKAPARAPRARRGAKKRVASADIEALRGAKRASLPRRPVPQLATLVSAPPTRAAGAAA